MLKKFLIITLILFSALGIFGASQPHALAQTGDVGSTEFKFRLGGSPTADDPQQTGIIHKEISQVDWREQGINYILSRLITIMAATAGSVAILMMMIGGVMILISAGDQTRYDQGKGLIFKAAIGLVFVFGAYIMVTAVQLLIKGIYG